MELRTVKYKRHEFRSKPVVREQNLLTFVYDIPYFGACGVFPPAHIINQIFKDGGGDGGMSPGTSWTPFTMDEEEYALPVSEVRATPVSVLEQKARFAYLQFTFDKTFDYI